MPGGLGSGAAFNPSSPSSHAGCVAAIVTEFIDTAPPGPVRVLDIGGTGAFAARRPEGARAMVIVTVNPDTRVAAEFDDIRKLDPPDAAPYANCFDLAMMFGVSMYMDREELGFVLGEVRRRLKPHGAMLVADPDPESITGGLDVILKALVHPVRQVPGVGRVLGALGIPAQRLTPWRAGEIEDALRAAHFSRVDRRPDLTPWGRGSYRLPPYFCLAARP